MYTAKKMKGLLTEMHIKRAIAPLNNANKFSITHLICKWCELAVSYSHIPFVAFYGRYTGLRTDVKRSQNQSLERKKKLVGGLMLQHTYHFGLGELTL